MGGQTGRGWEGEARGRKGERKIEERLGRERGRWREGKRDTHGGGGGGEKQRGEGAVWRQTDRNVAPVGALPLSGPQERERWGGGGGGGGRAEGELR